MLEMDTTDLYTGTSDLLNYTTSIPYEGAASDAVFVTPQWTIILEAATLSLIAIAAGALNTIIIYTIHKKTYLQNASNRFIYSMTLANAVMSFTVLPFNLAACVLRDWIFGVVMCNLMGFISLCTLTGSLFNVALITLDRYYAIVQPMMYPLKVTSNYTTHLIVCVWILALVCTLPPSFGWSRYSFQMSKSACMVDWHYEKSFSLFYAIMTTVFPLFLICFCYGNILKVAKRSSRRVSHGNVVVEEAIQKMTRRRSRRTSLLVNIRMNSPTKALRTVLVTVGAILITWCPFIIELMYEMVHGDELIADWLEAGAMWLSYCSLIFNPVIYAIWNKTVRNEVLGMFCARSLKLQWAWRDDDNILARRRESRRLSISGSITDLSYTSALRRKFTLQSTQVTNTGQQTSSGDSVASGVHLASIIESSTTTAPDTGNSSSGKSKQAKLNSGVKKTRVERLKTEPTTQISTTAQVHRPSQMITRSMSGRSSTSKVIANGGGKSVGSGSRKLSIVSFDESTVS
ncbi:G-protein coupled receptor 161-like [Lytechinus pictus]|uniref:G-protein coupled receptor 161-like n=1 Tax=Lytechinus pictus TaxID=7653 RepID=UPI0030B9D1E7